MKTQNNRTFNFSAGPATLPLSVLERVQKECLDWNDGISIMEVSHRSKKFIELLNSTKDRLRRLLLIPDDYHILFLQGGATTQFAMTALNCVGENKRAGYVQTGIWSTKAIKEAEKFIDTEIIASSLQDDYKKLPSVEEWKLDDNLDYVHYTTNETINGLEHHNYPDVGEIPLIADMSSNILSRSLDVERYSVIYAGAQKNLGPAGLTLVILHDSQLGRADKSIPSMLQYNNHVKADSCYNTPPTFAVYVMGLVLKWIENQGGIEAIEKHNIEKAEKLYRYIDESDFYTNNIVKNSRSRMNIPFTLSDETFNDKFLSLAAAKGLHNLTGHRSVGGMRASIYNAMTKEGVDELIYHMQDFKETL